MSRRSYHMRINTAFIDEPVCRFVDGQSGLCAVMVHELEAMTMRPSWL